MAKRKRMRSDNHDATPPRLVVTRADFEKELDLRIEAGEELLQRQLGSAEDYERLRDDHATWHEYNRELLLGAFSNPTLGYEYARQSPGAIPMNPTMAERVQYFDDRIREEVRRLRSLRGRLHLYTAGEQPAAPPDGHSASPDAPAGIFLVHGRNTEAREEVARFLERVTHDGVTILHEKPNEGQVLLEKFEKHGGASAFAVVLLTGDDEGRLRADQDEDRPLVPRARQNVAFELGFFVGALGRNRVAVLYEEEVDLPSDLKGLAYIPYPEGEWRVRLARELRAAGIDIDADRLL